MDTHSAQYHIIVVRQEDRTFSPGRSRWEDSRGDVHEEGRLRTRPLWKISKLMVFHIIELGI